MSGVEWLRCDGCGRLSYAKKWERNDHVCIDCGHHRRLSAGERIVQLVDPGSFVPIDLDVATDDPLDFVDLKPYAERAAAAQRATGRQEAAVLGRGTIEGHPVVLVVLEFAFMGGSMGTGVGELVTHAAELAAETRTPLIAVCASGGARMQEGVLSLLQMARTSQAMARLHEAGVLSFCLLTDPTYGGVSASFAMLGGVVVAESGAHVGFAGRRVIEQTVREELPTSFQDSAFLLRHGLVDRVERRQEIRPLLARLLRLHSPAAITPAEDLLARRNSSLAPVPSARRPDAWDVVQAARDKDRPTTLDYLREIADDVVEMHGDRSFGDDPALVAAVCSIDGRPVVLLGHQKGHTTTELVARNFGMPQPEGYRKAMRMMEYAERYRLPVVTLVDTPGAYPGVEAEQRGQSTAIAQIIMRSTRLRVPVVSVVTGEGGSGGALALASGDRLLMLENSFLSVISPEGCAAILWRTALAAPEAARALRLTAADLVELGIADGIVPEPVGGAQSDPATAAANLRSAVTAALDELTHVHPDALVAARYRRLASLGAPASVEAEVRSA